jgi:hypothetical protein
MASAHHLSFDGVDDQNVHQVGKAARERAGWRGIENRR